jgi:hypothetical protein
MPSEAEILAARLARIKQLVEGLEAVCSHIPEQRESFVKLKRELDAVREALKPPK